MALNHSVLKARVRHPEEGADEYVTLAESTGTSGGANASAEVVNRYQELMGNSDQGKADRKTYSSAVLIVDNGLRSQHEFPDQDTADQKAARSQEIKDAKAQKSAADGEITHLQRTLAEAQAKKAEAQQKLTNLTGEPLPEPSATEGETPTSTENDPDNDDSPGSGDSPPTEPGSPDPELASEPDSEPDQSVEAIAARFESGETVTAEELDKALTVPQLTDLCARYDREIPEGAKKADIIQLLLAEDEPAE